MTPGARIAAAIEVLAMIEGQRRPAADAMKDWGYAHRFAGSKDRSAIASLVYDALRRRRLYKPAISHGVAIRHMLERSQGQFDPTLLGALASCHPQFEGIYHEIGD